MRKLYFIVVVIFLPLAVSAQRTVIATGNWNTGTTWQGGNIANTLSDDVVMNDGFTVTVAGGDAFHVGNLGAGNTNTLTIASGGDLELGDAGNPRNLTAGTDMTINASGDLIIWGDLLVNNNNLIMTITVPGHIIVKGNLIVADFASFTCNGNLEVDGAFTAGHDTNVTLGAGGNVFVYGPTTVGANSHVIGSGHFHTYGGCSGPGTFCNTSPVELRYFEAEPLVSSVRLTWMTASELNFDYFIIEKSVDGNIFTEVGSVPGHGTSNVKNNYLLDDLNPHVGKSYYRLTEVDMDHSITHLKWITVDFTGDKAVNLFPNPVVNGQVTFKLNFVPAGDVGVTIFDLRGILLSEFMLNQPEVTLPVQLSGGTYVVQVRSADFKSVHRLVIK